MRELKLDDNKGCGGCGQEEGFSWVSHSDFEPTCEEREEMDGVWYRGKWENVVCEGLGNSTGCCPGGAKIREC